MPSEVAAATPDIDTLARSFARRLRAANRSPETDRSYLDSVAGLDAYLGEAGMPRAVAASRREHVESYIEDRLASHKLSTALGPQDRGRRWESAQVRRRDVRHLAPS